MLKFEIKHRWNGTILLKHETDNMQDANLKGAYLRGAYLQGANLRDANLRDANLQGANLQGANLRDANLQGANLQGANLRDANLQGANLQCANLQDAYLQDANLRDANLQDANLKGAYLRGANLDPLVIDRTIITPDGHLTGWKKCRNNVIVKLSIPEEARRSNATGRKCRAEFAIVAEIFGAETATSSYDNSVVYRVGETVQCHEWDECRWNECSGGIHFFLTKEEAEAY